MPGEQQHNRPIPQEVQPNFRFLDDEHMQDLEPIPGQEGVKDNKTQNFNYDPTQDIVAYKGPPVLPQIPINWGGLIAEDFMDYCRSRKIRQTITGAQINDYINQFRRDHEYTDRISNPKNPDYITDEMFISYIRVSKLA